jgi:hypothetical protein
VQAHTTHQITSVLAIKLCRRVLALENNPLVLLLICLGHWIDIGFPVAHIHQASHAIEPTPGAIGVGTHATEAQPIPNLDSLGDHNLPSDDIKSVAGHTEQLGLFHVLGLELSMDLLIGDLPVELVGVVPEAHAIHQNTVECVVKRVVDVVAFQARFIPDTGHTDHDVATEGTEVPARFGHHFVA